MSTTSLSLLDRVARTADSESWSRLAEVYAPLLRHWLGRFQVQDADADDLIQEVLATVARELPEFQHNERKGAFRSWLRTVLIHRLRDFWRSAKYRPIATGATSLHQQLDELADDASHASRLWDKEHDEFIMKRLMDAVQPRFDPQTWQAFRLQTVGGRAAREVAEELGMTINSVYLAKSHVLNALRREAAGLIE